MSLTALLKPTVQVASEDTKSATVPSFCTAISWDAPMKQKPMEPPATQVESHEGVKFGG